MSLAKGRARRAKAGNRMARILNEEEEDEFYTTTYGGFKDADDDVEYRLEKEEADVVDSDFDIEEDDAPASDQDEDGDQRKRSRRLVTRAYKEPKAKEPLQKKQKITATSSKRVSRTQEIKEEKEEDAPRGRRTRRSSLVTKSPSPAPGPSRGRVTRHSARVDSESTSEAEVAEHGVEAAGPSTKRSTRKRKLSESEMPDFTPKPLEEVPRPKRQVARPSLGVEKRVQFTSTDKKDLRTTVRSSTKQKSMETEKRIKIREKESDKRKKVLLSRKVEYEMPTQEELLEETKWTEIINLESLAKFQQMELEKKKMKPVRNVASGPVIRYHSVTMPRVKLVSDGDEENKKKLTEVLAEGEERANAPPLPPLPKLEDEGPDVYERTFISFSDDNLFKEAFDRGPPKPIKPKRQLCALTRIKTAYHDPVLNLPYYNSDVFKVLRAAYHRILYHRGDRRIPQVRKYCDWLESEYPHLFNKGKLQKLAASDSDHVSRRGLKRKIKAGAESKKGLKKASDVEVEADASAEPGTPVVTSDDKYKSQAVDTPPATPGPSTSAELMAQEAAKKRPSPVGPNWMSQVGFSRPKSRPCFPHLQSPFIYTPSSYRPPASRIQGLKKPERAPTALPNILRPKALSPSKKPNVKLPLASSMFPIKTYPAKGTPVTTPTITTRPPGAVPPAVPISVVQSPAYSPRQVLLAKRNIGPVVSTLASPASNMGAVTGTPSKGTSILIRASNPAQLQPTNFQQLAAGSPGTTIFGMTGTTPAGTIQLGNTQLPLTLVSFSRTGGGVPAVIRGTGLNANMASNQVVRLLQSQKIQILQQPLVSTTGLLTNQQTGTAGINMPVTLRLPPQGTPVQGSPQAASPAACSTASAIVAANTAGRLARSAATGAQQITPTRPVSATTTVVARPSPITATGLNTAPRLIKTSPTGIRQAAVRTLTASQLKAVLAATTGQTIIRSGTPTTIISASGQQRTVSTITPGVRAISGVAGMRSPGSATAMASTMLRPVTIPTAGMRTLNPNAGVIGIRNMQPGGTRMVGLHTAVRGPQTASALVAASGRNIRFAARPGMNVSTSPGGPPRQSQPPPLAGGPPSTITTTPLAVPTPSTPVVPKESTNVTPQTPQ